MPMNDNLFTAPGDLQMSSAISLGKEGNTKPTTEGWKLVAVSIKSASQWFEQEVHRNAI